MSARPRPSTPSRSARGRQTHGERQRHARRRERGHGLLAGRRRRQPDSRRPRRPRRGGSGAGGARSREAAVQPRSAEGGAGAIAREVRREPSPASLPPDRADARCEAGGGRAEPGQAGLRPRHRAEQAPARVPGRRSTTPTPALRAKQAELRPVAAEREEHGGRHRRGQRRRQARRPAAARRQHPGAVRRLRPAATGLARRARQGRRCR